MPEPGWTEIREYLGKQLTLAYRELAEARTIEDIWRYQGKVQVLQALQYLDQALKMTTDKPAPEGGSHAR